MGAVVVQKPNDGAACLQIVVPLQWKMMREREDIGRWDCVR
jgi:hypothetical protein